ncbi:MAG: metal-dependent transcriptional regulator [Cyclobacteriaceae bacterium]|nr:metal-dependent transcriptional regulator [Cyclobacteriaceae bacterium]
MEELTLAEENYLKAIYHLSGGGSDQVNTNSIADKLKTKPASVSDMIRKLADKGTIDYVKYQGVQITNDGKNTALQVIRKHRLWEVFLVDKLGFHWDEVHEIAEQLEHIRSPLLISRLDEFLGFPKFDPHGDPIPDEFGVISSKPRIILSTLQNGTNCTLVSMRDTGNAFLNYLDRIQLPIGSEIRIQAIIEFDNSMEIQVNGTRSITISKQVADNLLVVRK